MSFYSCFVLFVFYNHISSAQNQGMDIEHLLEKAVANSLAVQAQKQRVQQQTHLNSLASAWSNPNVVVESQKGLDNTGAPIEKYQFGLVQPLTSPWKTNIKRRISGAELNIENHHLEDQVLSTKINTLRLIFSYNISLEKTKKTNNHLKRIEILKTFLKSRKFVSGQKQAEAFIVENKLKILKKQLDDLTIVTQKLWLQLNQVLNFSDPAQLKSYWVDQTLQLDKVSYLQKALNSNHDIELSQFQIDKSQAELAYEKNQKLPDLSLAGGLSRGRNGNPEDNYTLGVNMSLPIFNMNINKTRAQANALEESKYKKALVVQQVEKDFRSTFHEYELARQQILEFPLTNLNKLEKDMRNMTETFKRGQIDLMTFVEADVIHDNLIDETLNIQMSYIYSLSELSFLVGEMVPLKGVIHEINL